MSSEEFKAKDAWKTYDEKIDEIHSFAEKYIQFLNACKTERETVAYVADQLKNNGYAESFDGNFVFRICRNKSIFAARRGKKPLSEGISLISAHADSPRLDFKQHPFLEQTGVVQAKTHYYGGIRKYQWLARPLAIHGTIVKQDGSVINISIGDKQGDPVFTIVDLLPHLAYKEIEKTVKEAFDPEKLNIIVGHKTPDDDKANDKSQPLDGTKNSKLKSAILDLLKKEYGIEEEDFFSAEIETVPADKANFVGFDKALVGGYGQDDRICVFTALSALLSAKNPEHSCAVMFWDKEEIGSYGATGAQSSFFEHCIKDLRDAWEPNVKFRKIIEKSKALSADVHAGLDPDFQDYHDSLNSAVLGKGACFCKFTGSRGKYGANDANPEYIGMLRGILNKRGIPWQMAELGKVDLGGGGTVAMYLAKYNMDVIDCGPALLGMHSPFEISSAVDVYAAWQLYNAFFEEA